MHLYGLAVRARGQAGGYICHDSNALTQRSVLNTVAWTAPTPIPEGVWTHMQNIHTHTYIQEIGFFLERQACVCINKCTMKFVWIGVRRFLNVEEYTHAYKYININIQKESAVHRDTRSPSTVCSYVHIEIQTTAHFPASIWNTKTTIDPLATHSLPR